MADIVHFPPRPAPAPSTYAGPELCKAHMQCLGEALPRPGQFILLKPESGPVCFARWGAGGDGFTRHGQAGFVTTWMDSDLWIGIEDLL
ncbi:MAG: hypothetical protein RJQ08_11810 [Salinisphaeraceae bacterium]